MKQLPEGGRLARQVFTILIFREKVHLAKKMVEDGWDPESLMYFITSSN